MAKSTQGWESLYEEMEAKLKDVFLQEERFLPRTQRCILITEEYLEKLRDCCLGQKFGSQQEEIHFFKTVKPKFTSKLMYNIYLYNLEYRRPRNQYKLEKKYLLKQLKKINEFFEENNEFYKYYKSEATYLDHRFFVRGVRDVHLLLDTRIYYFDKEFTTSHGHLVASFLAYEMLLHYIEKELRRLDKQTLTTQTTPASQLHWTESKVALTELVYALHSTGAINNGNVEIGEIALAFESVFNVELNNYYRSYMEMRLRKNNRTKFLDELKRQLTAKMNEDDDKR